MQVLIKAQETNTTFKIANVLPFQMKKHYTNKVTELRVLKF